MIVSEKAGRGGREKMYEVDLISQSINRNAIKHVIVNILYYIKKSLLLATIMVNINSTNG